MNDKIGAFDKLVKDISIGELSWRSNNLYHYAYLNEVIQEDKDIKIYRFFTYNMFNRGILSINPQIKFKLCKSGWKAYFLINNDSNIPEFETRGIDCNYWLKEVVA